MTPEIIVALMGSGSFLAFVFILSVFGGTTSTVEKWIDARKTVKLAQLAVRKLEAEHLQKCPRLTDTPRER